MTKEQEEAIERCKKIITTKFNLDYSIDNYDKEAIETVLKMLKEKDAEIEKLKEENKNAWNLNANMSKRHLEDSSKIKKKDKIIDLMAEWIEKHTKYYDEDGCYCEVEKEVCNKDIKCKDCIKQYFERKAAEED